MKKSRISIVTAGLFLATVLVGMVPTTALGDGVPLNVTPSIIGFKQLAPREFEVVTSWNVQDSVPAGYRIFDHVTSQSGGPNDVVLQPDTGITMTPDQWISGTPVVSSAVIVTLPANFADGQYDYKVGIYNTTKGDRLALTGTDDGSRRYKIGTLIVANSGASITMPGIPTVTPQQEGRVDLVPSAGSFQQTGPRQFSLVFSWDVKDKVPDGERVFVHVVALPSSTPNPTIASGGGFASTPDTWAVGQKVVGNPVVFTFPQTAADGTYAIKVGMYAPANNGNRLRLAIPDDGQWRYQVGSVTLSGNGSTITFQSH